MESRYEYLKGVEERSIPKNVISEQQMKEFKYENGGIDKADSFVVDLENVSLGVDNDPTNISTPNSRITLQRTLIKKTPQRGNERKINDRDNNIVASLSPRVLNIPTAQATSMPEKSLPPISIPMGSQDNSPNHQLPQHQITIKTGGLNTVPEGRWGRRSSFKRSSISWFAQPKRILLLFATLSCMGTMLLIYFTLSMSKRNDKEAVLDWQQ